MIGFGFFELIQSLFGFFGFEMDGLSWILMMLLLLLLLLLLLWWLFPYKSHKMYASPPTPPVVF